MADLVSLGELLIDFTPCGESERGNPLFERNPGGGPANMACAAAKLGTDTAFIGQVGDDVFGHVLRDVLIQNHVDTGRLRLSHEYQTTLAFVHLTPEGDRSFSFYRRQGADTMLDAEPEDFALIDGCRCFFYSAVLMTGGPSRQASFDLAAHARSRHILTVFDPNLRLNLWSSGEEAKRCILHAMHWADVVKVSEEELIFLTGGKDMETAGRMLMEAYGMKLLLVTLGAEGCCALRGDTWMTVPPCPADTIDTTGAGDAFTGGFLTRLLESHADPAELTDAQLMDMLRFANAVGALTTAKRGGIPALPERDAVEAALTAL